MKVLFTTDGVFPNVIGGIARHSRGLVEHLARAGAEITVVHPGPVAFEVPNVDEVLVEQPSSSIKGHYLWETYELSRRIGRAIERSADRYDVGYAQGGSMWSYLPRRAFPVVVNPHGLEMFQQIGRRESLRSLPFRWIMRRQVTQGDRVVSLGGRLGGILHSRCGVERDRIITIPNAVDAARIRRLVSGVGRRPATFLYIGRLFPNKGAVELIDAFNGVDSEASLAVVGDGPLREQLQRSAAHPRISFEGVLPDDRLFSLLGSTEALILPTLGEGMPTVILEAMAAGLPIIATDVGAVSELVDGSNGFLIPPGDVSALREAVEAFLSLSSTVRRDMGIRSRVKVEERFTWDEVAGRTYRHLEVLARRGISR